MRRIGHHPLGWQPCLCMPNKKKLFHWGGTDRLLKRLFLGFYLGMDQYLLIPFLVGWTSIYQLFWCELQGYKVLTHPHFWDFIWRQWFLLNCADTRCARGQLQIRHGRCLDDRQDDLDGLAWSFSEFLGIWHGQPESHLGIVVLVGGFAQVFGIICIYIYIYICICIYICILYICILYI